MCGGGLANIIKPLHKISDPLDLFKKAGLPTSLDLLPQEAQTAETTTAASTQATNIASDVQSARDDEKRRRAAAAGLSSTILGGSMAGTTTGNKVLLGQ
ncbi:hypothetical protein EXN22_16245 [Pseudomonas tructae]|uniref:Uncharacterized protein n=1 Tax=Pseudomonas tructae TaxID=2518644 RepID=A0A411MK45_9PSED|nr:hypothetical protein [Pseudomonas tructae]QBF27165.1 hypothetical protein EXN22_16245 [Pseudomonas tructae]